MHCNKNDKISLVPVSGGFDDTFSMLHRNGKPVVEVDKNVLLESWKRLIEERKTVRHFTFWDNRVHIIYKGIEDGHYFEVEEFYYLDWNLSHDKEFMDEIIKLSCEFESLWHQTSVNMEKILKDNVGIVNRDKEIKELAIMIANEYVQTGKITEDITDSTAKRIRDFILRHKGELSVEESFASISPKSKILKVLNGLYKFSPLTTALYIAFGSVLSAINLEHMFLYSMGFYLPLEGTVLTLGFTGKMDKWINKNRWACIEDLIRTLEKSYDMTKTDIMTDALENELEKNTGEKFLGFIKKDFEYFARNDVKFERALRNLSELLKVYSENKDGYKFDKFYFMNWLLELEREAFVIHKCDNEKPLYDVSTLEERLEYLGFEFIDDLTSSFVSDVFDEVARICELPYDGCEEELIRLFELAVQYCESVSNRDVKYFDKGEEAGKLYLSLSDLQTEVTRKINDAYELEEEDTKVENRIVPIDENHKRIALI